MKILQDLLTVGRRGPAQAGEVLLGERDHGRTRIEVLDSTGLARRAW